MQRATATGGELLADPNPMLPSPGNDTAREIIAYYQRQNTTRQSNTEAAHSVLLQVAHVVQDFRRRLEVLEVEEENRLGFIRTAMEQRWRRSSVDSSLALEQRCGAVAGVDANVGELPIISCTRTCAVCLEDQIGSPRTRPAQCQWPNGGRFVCVPVRKDGAAGGVPVRKDGAAGGGQEWSGCCGADVCGSCMTQYLEAQIQDSSRDLQCPGQCRRTLTDEEVSLFVTRDAMQKFTTRRALRLNADLRACPGCAHLNQSSAVAPDMICERCNISFCFHHDLQHPGLSCRSYTSSSMSRSQPVQEWKTALTLARTTIACPSCRARIQRNGGCSRITCRCGAEFCWKCGKSASLQQREHRRFWSNDCCTPKRLLEKFGIVVAAPVVGVVVLAAAPVVGLAVAAKKCSIHARRKTASQTEREKVQNAAKKAAKTELNNAKKMQQIERKKAIREKWGNRKARVFNGVYRCIYGENVLENYPVR